MNKKEKSGLYVFISAVAINVISSIIYAIIEKVDFFTALKSIWKILITFLVNLLSIELRLWQVLVFLLILVFVIKLYFDIKSKSKVNTIRPVFMDFTNGVYKGIHNKWELVKTYDNRIKMENFRPICHCGAELTTKRQHNHISYGKEKLFCVNCDEIIEADFDYEIKEDAKLYFSNELNKKINQYNESIQV